MNLGQLGHQMRAEWDEQSEQYVIVLLTIKSVKAGQLIAFAELHNAIVNLSDTDEEEAIRMKFPGYERPVLCKLETLLRYLKTGKASFIK